MTHTHPHKNPFLLNFVFCFLLLFSLNTSLKSACTGDIDLNGANIINVDEIIYAVQAVYNTIEIGGTTFVDPKVSAGHFAHLGATCQVGIGDTAPVGASLPTDNYYMITYADKTNTALEICPSDTTMITLAQAIALTSNAVLIAIEGVSYWGNPSSTQSLCKLPGDVYIFVSDNNNLYYGTDFASSGDFGDLTRAVPLCILDNQP